jgi:hypothetical protein
MERQPKTPRQIVSDANAPVGIAPVLEKIALLSLVPEYDPTRISNFSYRLSLKARKATTPQSKATGSFHMALRIRTMEFPETFSLFKQFDSHLVDSVPSVSTVIRMRITVMNGCRICKVR